MTKRFVESNALTRLLAIEQAGPIVLPPLLRNSDDRDNTRSAPVAEDPATDFIHTTMRRKSELRYREETAHPADAALPSDWETVFVRRPGYPEWHANATQATVAEKEQLQQLADRVHGVAPDYEEAQERWTDAFEKTTFRKLPICKTQSEIDFTTNFVSARSENLQR